VRFWLEGLGLYRSLQLGSLATGRPFFLQSPVGEVYGEPQVWITKRAEDDLQAALLDLFETLAIDERDTSHIIDGVDLSLLPVWELWRLDAAFSQKRPFLPVLCARFDPWSWR